MLNLIRSDLYEIRHSKSFFVCLIVAALVSVICIASTALLRFAYATSDGEYTVEDVADIENDDFATAFTKGFYSGLNEATDAVNQLGSEQVIEFYKKIESGTLTSVEAMKYSFGDGSTFPMLLSIFISIYVCGEFTKKTIHNKVSKGFSRTGIYVSKLLVSVIASGFLTMLTALVYALVSVFVFGTANVTDVQIYDYIATLLCALLVNAAFSSLYVMVSFVLKNSVIAVAVNVGFVSTLSFSLSLTDMMSAGNTCSTNLWLGSLLSKVQVAFISPELVSNVLLLSFMYIALTTMLGIYSINKRDI